MLNILHVLAPAPFGGLESVVRAMAIGHAASGNRVTIVASVDSADHPFVQTMRANGIAVIEIRAGGRDYRRERREFSVILAQIRPDVVHSHGYRTDILDLPVARAAGIPTVTTLHGFTGGDWKLRMYERLQLRSVRAASAVVAVSRGVELRLTERNVPSSRLHLIRNAHAASTPLASRAEARQALGIGGDAQSIGWIGRLSEEKGPDVMLEAMGLLTGSAATLSFVGDGPARAALEARALQLGVADRVRFHGVVPDAARFLRAFDVLALSSRTEGTPMVILEAMAAETPIVATRVGGVPDVLSPLDALLVDAERPDQLAAALRSTLHDTEVAATRALAARQRLLTEFGEQAWLDRYLQLYASLSR